MTTLQEQFGRLAERGPIVDPPFVVRRAIQLASADAISERTPAGRSSLASRRLQVYDDVPVSERLPQHRPRRFGMVAAAVVAVAGLLGMSYVRSGVESPVRGSDPTAPSADSLPDATVQAPPDPTTGPLLTTPVPADVQPLVSITRPGWTIDSTTGFEPAAAPPSSSACPGCGATRLVLAADGPPFSGPLFTAWTLDDDYDLNQLDTPVTIGAIPGRAKARADSTPTALNRMTVAWPLGPGRTAFVDASGFPNEQVIEMAASLTFESAIPVMAVRPAGFHQIDAPVPGMTTTETFLNLTDGRSSIELYATNAGLHGLLDWRAPGHVLFRELQPYVLDGATIAFDAHPAPERPIVALDAYWVAGGWGYLVVGHIFDSEAEFFDVLSDLHLTDSATFAAATADTNTTLVFEGMSSSTGWT